MTTDEGDPMPSPKPPRQRKKPTPDEMPSSATIRFLNPDVQQRLYQAAAERDLSVNYLVNCAVSEFLDRLIPLSEFRLTYPVPPHEG
jgi:hypothetical protein